MKLCIWWTSRQVVQYELLLRGYTITADYSQDLERVQQALQKNGENIGESQACTVPWVGSQVYYTATWLGDSATHRTAVCFQQIITFCILLTTTHGFL